jgi:hypothetical protein
MSLYLKFRQTDPKAVAAANVVDGSIYVQCKRLGSFRPSKRMRKLATPDLWGFGLITVATFADVRGFRSFPRLLS